MAEQTPQPAGFPNCGKCALFKTGSATICGRCARDTLPRIKPPLCPVCSQAMSFGTCSNRLCNDPKRTITRIDAIAANSSPLRDCILSYKNRGVLGWAVVFGRILTGHLADRYSPDTVDLVVANPTPPKRHPRHTELVLASAAQEDLLGTWHFDTSTPAAATKPAGTSRSGVTGTNWDTKRQAADDHAAALVVRADLIGNKRLLLYDDICTTGLQLDAVARRLVAEGARSVGAVVLARTPWA